MAQPSESLAESSQCPYCDEPFVEGDEIERSFLNAVVHRECMIRMVVGSAAHQLGDCTCSGGSRSDPPGLSRRQAARVALDVFMELRHA